jgi:CRISPR-associated autoregulator DevR family
MTWSVSISYRLGLGFHALNNEGSDGSNLMQPRRIDVGRMTYDGISGEMVRRHILENLVRVCEMRQIPLLTASRALHPDRGPLGLREVAKTKIKADALTKDNVFDAARVAVEECALLDVGGYLAAFSDKGGGPGIPESGFLKAIAELIPTEKPTTVKRDSVFDVGWLISEEPQEMTVTQHAAYRPTGDQSMFSQAMRSNVYGGVMRADLHRVGTDDYWYLHRDTDGKTKTRVVVVPEEVSKRQKALIQAMIDYIASPAGAKTAGWAPHVFKTEGVILLTSARTAPFASPIKVNLEDPDGRAIRADSTYQARMAQLQNESDTWAWTFSDVKTLLDAGSAVFNRLDGKEAKQ